METMVHLAPQAQKVQLAQLVLPVKLGKQALRAKQAQPAKQARPDKLARQAQQAQPAPPVLLESKGLLAPLDQPESKVLLVQQA
jgi:hypothetical protein